MSQGIFIKQTQTRLVKGRQTFKVPNRYAPSCENPQYQVWRDENSDRELSDLELLYKEFCKKAFDLIAGDPSLNGDKHPERIIFHDFTYEVIPRTITIE